jgi:hypothetical protein
MVCQPLAGLLTARGLVNGHSQGEFDVFNYYQLIMLFLNMVCLTKALAGAILFRGAVSFCDLRTFKKHS